MLPCAEGQETLRALLAGIPPAWDQPAAAGLFPCEPVEVQLRETSEPASLKPRLQEWFFSAI